MSNSDLYRVHLDKKILQSVKEVDFADFGVKERFDIQEWIETTPEILGEELLIISKEKSYFKGTRERPDLIAMDKAGNIVIIELKRDDSGENVEWQAIKYASYWSKFKISDILDVFADYLSKKPDAIDEVDEATASQRLEEFVTDGAFDNINTKQRIFLVSHRFAKEVTSTVHWLIEKNSMDVKCIQLIPYFDKDKEAYYLQANTILPVSGVEDLIISAAGMRGDGIKVIGPVRKNDDVTKFFETLRDELYETLPRDLVPQKNSRWAGVEPGYRYYHFYDNSAIWDNWNNSYKIWLYNKEADKKYADKFFILLDISKKHLLTRGVTEEDLQKFITFLKESSIEGYKFIENNDNISLESWLDNNQLSDKTRKAVIEKIAALIKGTKAFLSKLEK